MGQALNTRSTTRASRLRCWHRLLTLDPCPESPSPSPCLTTSSLQNCPLPPALIPNLTWDPQRPRAVSSLSSFCWGTPLPVLLSKGAAHPLQPRTLWEPQCCLPGPQWLGHSQPLCQCESRQDSEGGREGLGTWNLGSEEEGGWEAQTPGYWGRKGWSRLGLLGSDLTSHPPNPGGWQLKPIPQPPP